MEKILNSMKIQYKSGTLLFQGLEYILKLYKWAS